MIRVVSLLQDPDTIVKLARLELTDNVVTSVWFDPDFRDLLAGWKIKPSDGRAFLDEIDRVFGRSSRIIVETGP